jgi:nicotinate-nucleotide adenylyltransferase
MAGLAERLDQARRTARHPRIRVGDLESGLATRYTADTVARLGELLPRTRFVWLMGADNLAQIGRWGRWTLIFHSLPVAVCDRPTYSLRAFAGVAAKRFARSRWRERKVGRLAAAEPPAWTFLHGPLHPASATAIRAGQPRRRRIGP